MQLLRRRPVSVAAVSVGFFLFFLLFFSFYWFATLISVRSLTVGGSKAISKALINDIANATLGVRILSILCLELYGI